MVPLGNIHFIGVPALAADMAEVRLGKMHLRWCDHCNVPVLEEAHCARCGDHTHQVEMTPPGDARPAFRHDIEFVRKYVDLQFGEGSGEALMPDGSVYLFNKVPALDRMDEVIADGEVIVTMRYDLGLGWRRCPGSRPPRGSFGRRPRTWSGPTRGGGAHSGEPEPDGARREQGGR